MQTFDEPQFGHCWNIRIHKIIASIEVKKLSNNLSMQSK